MIGLEELMAASERLHVPLSDVQRDYVFGWLIGGVYEGSALRDRLVLKGGNALRKGYFPATRYSDDLDFSTPGEISPEELLAVFNDVCRFASARSGVTFDLERNRVVDVVELDGQRLAVKLRLYFNDFSGELGNVVLKVRLDVTEYDRLVLPPTRRRLIHQYSDASDCDAEISCVALEENIADKMKCLLQRRHSHDLFDLVYSVLVNRDVDVDRRQVVATFLKKTIFEPSPRSAGVLLLAIPFEGMRLFWDRIVSPAASELNFDDAVARAKEIMQSFFGVGPATRVADSYFPPEMRNPIIEAGAERRLLAVTYQRIPRLVEPYSLTFMRRLDGVAQEYLWVYDRTGGRNSGPGMKRFVRSGLQSVSIAEEVFEPRHEVMLAKAGDREASGRLARQFPSGPRGTPGSAVRSRGGRREAKYLIECRYCSRQFPHMKPTVALRKHLDGYGNRCPGRRGYRVY